MALNNEQTGFNIHGNFWQACHAHYIGKVFDQEKHYEYDLIELPNIDQDALKWCTVSQLNCFYDMHIKNECPL